MEYDHPYTAPVQLIDEQDQASLRRLCPGLPAGDILGCAILARDDSDAAMVALANKETLAKWERRGI